MQPNVWNLKKIFKKKKKIQVDKLYESKLYELKLYEMQLYESKLYEMLLSPQIWYDEFN